MSCITTHFKGFQRLCIFHNLKRNCQAQIFVEMSWKSSCSGLKLAWDAKDKLFNVIGSKISSENMWQEVRFCEDASNPNTADLCRQVRYGLLQLGESGRRTGSSAHRVPALDKLAQGFCVFWRFQTERRNPNCPNLWTHKICGCCKSSFV